MATLERAIAIAAEAHAGQVDKGGAPYILHPLRVMMAVEGEAARIVAVLHDVVEDCPDFPLARLEVARFLPEVIAGIDAVTRRPGELYRDFVARAARDPIGRVVKRADIMDNMDLSRITDPTEADQSRVKRYRAALEILG